MIFLWIVSIVLGVYLVAMLEAWTFSGKLQLTGPFSRFLALFTQESLVPRTPDKILFETAPFLLLIAPLAASIVLPFSQNAAFINLGTGALFVNAALIYILVASFMAGWGPNGNYAMIGAFRSVSQLLSYAMPIVMSIVAVSMRAQSLSMTDVVVSQQNLWNIVYMPLGFVIFYTYSLAISFLPPFNLPNSIAIAGGIDAEYTGIRLSIIRIGRLATILVLSGAITSFFLGGWNGPFLPSWLWNIFKTFLVAISMLIAGRFVPSIRQDHLLEWSWKIGIPAALLNIFITGLIVLYL